MINCFINICGSSSDFWDAESTPRALLVEWITDEAGLIERLEILSISQT